MAVLHGRSAPRLIIHERANLRVEIDSARPHLPPDAVRRLVAESEHPVSFSSTYLTEVSVLYSLFGNAVDGRNAMRMALVPILDAA
jgi:hypothetical protein